MRRAERLDGILARLASDGSVSVRELTETLGASSATVRRDLRLLEEQKLLSRSHGGAVSNGLLYELPVPYRGGQHAAEKRRIAEAAADRIADAQTVGLTGGTTTTEVARRLRDRKLTVVTNAVNIASELVISPDDSPCRHRRGGPTAVLRADRSPRRAHPGGPERRCDVPRCRWRQRLRGHHPRRDRSSDE